jgi:hypothetical protein
MTAELHCLKHRAPYSTLMPSGDAYCAACLDEWRMRSYDLLAGSVPDQAADQSAGQDPEP